MRRASVAPLDPFFCFACGTRLGWTSRGEAKRMNVRSHVFCDACRDKPQALTDRQQELLDALTAMRVAGKRPTFAGAADVLGVSRTRAQQIASSIRARGEGALLDAALGWLDEPEVATGVDADVVAEAEPPARTPHRRPVVEAPAVSNPTFSNHESAAANPSNVGGPAASGAEFV